MNDLTLWISKEFSYHNFTLYGYLSPYLIATHQTTPCGIFLASLLINSGEKSTNLGKCSCWAPLLRCSFVHKQMHWTMAWWERRRWVGCHGRSSTAKSTAWDIRLHALVNSCTWKWLIEWVSAREVFSRQDTNSAVADGYAAVGYNDVHIDDCWMAMQRDANGTCSDLFPSTTPNAGKLVSNQTRFPSGIANLAKYVYLSSNDLFKRKIRLYKVEAQCCGCKLLINTLLPCRCTIVAWDWEFTKTSAHTLVVVTQAAWDIWRFVYVDTCCFSPRKALTLLQTDADTFAAWKVDYLKLDGCYASEAEYKTGALDKHWWRMISKQETIIPFNAFLHWNVSNIAQVTPKWVVFWTKAAAK